MVFDATTALSFYIRKVKGKDQFVHFDKQAIALLPFNTDQSDELDPLLRKDFEVFDGFLGDCLRALQGKGNSLLRDAQTESIMAQEDDQPGSEDQSSKKKKAQKLLREKKVLKSAILANALDQTECKGVPPEKLRAVLESVYFSADNLLKYGDKAQLYMFRNSEDASEEISRFIFNLFFDEEISALIATSRDSKKHVFHRLVDESLPKLANSPGKWSKRNYHPVDQQIIDLFKKDFVFLYHDRDAFLSESALLFKFYYFFYVSKLILGISDIFTKKSYQLFFTLESESVSESRRTYEAGWKTLEWRTLRIFSHTICLDLVNHIPLVKQNGPLDYHGLQALYDGLDPAQQQALVADLDLIIKLYLERPSSDVNWEKREEFIEQQKLGQSLTNDFELKVFELQKTIDFQFEKFQRKNKRNGYGKWFSNFCKVNMLKSRGKYGYTLNLSNEMLLFLTKLCIGEQEKIRLKDLWVAFRQRGIHFDDPTQQAIVAIYEKINLIEKKSDSGDAQYIRRIL